MRSSAGWPRTASATRSSPSRSRGGRSLPVAAAAPAAARAAVLAASCSDAGRAPGSTAIRSAGGIVRRELAFASVGGRCRTRRGRSARPPRRSKTLARPRRRVHQHAPRNASRTTFAASSTACDELARAWDAAICARPDSTIRKPSRTSTTCRRLVVAGHNVVSPHACLLPVACLGHTLDDRL